MARPLLDPAALLALVGCAGAPTQAEAARDVVARGSHVLADRDRFTL